MYALDCGKKTQLFLNTLNLKTTNLLDNLLHAGKVEADDGDGVAAGLLDNFLARLLTLLRVPATQDDTRIPWN